MKSTFDASNLHLAAASTLLMAACGASPTPVVSSESTPLPTPVAVDSMTWQRGATSMTLQSGSDSAQAQLLIRSKDGKGRMDLEGNYQPWEEEPLAELVDAQDEAIWLAHQDKLILMIDGSAEGGASISLPAGTQSSAIESGFDHSVFVADAQANRIYWAKGSQAELFAQGEELQHPRALLLNGGSLVVGGDTGVFSIDIKSGERTELAQGPGVMGLALDHLGYIIVADQDGGISQLHSDGSMKLLHRHQTPITSIAFDDVTRSLFIAGAEAIAKMSYLELTGEDRALWSERDQRPMRAVSRHGMILSGAEFWPSHGTTEVSYPEDILWGFYPSPEQVFEGSSAALEPSQAAAQCAEKSYQALMQFFEASHEAFHQAAKASGASNRFYLWVNDYSDAAADFPHELRMNKFWYWQREPSVKGRVPGFWKWETTVLQDGSCKWPESEQIEAYLAEKIASAG